MICKFVFKGEEAIGESIDVYNEHLIVKVEANFIAIPVKNIEKVEGDRIVISDFDENEAKTIGEKWVIEKSKPISLEELKAFGFEDFKVEIEGEDKENKKEEKIEVKEVREDKNVKDKNGDTIDKL